MGNKFSMWVQSFLLILFAVLYGALHFLLQPGLSLPILSAVIAACFLLLAPALSRSSRYIGGRLEAELRQRGMNSVLGLFRTKIKVSVSIQDTIALFKELLEAKADFSCLFLDNRHAQLVYSSPLSWLSDAQAMKQMKDTFPLFPEGLSFFCEDKKILKKKKNARGFLFRHRRYSLAVFTCYPAFLDSGLLRTVCAEYLDYLDRVEQLEKMFELSSLSREWELLAKTQKSYLPKTIPQYDNLEIKAYFRPLVDVSGDYYDVIECDTDNVLFVLGDVSGKGLSAALVMGIVVNTIRISTDWKDLVGIIRNLHSAIETMLFEGKFTTVFLGHLNRKTGLFRYINAAMPEPIRISSSNSDQLLQALACNSGLVGIMDGDVLINSTHTAEFELSPGDTIVAFTDGVTEVCDDDYVQLGETEKFKEYLIGCSERSVSEIGAGLEGMVREHVMGNNMKDDMTYLIFRWRG